MKINKKITDYNKTTKNSTDRIKYIVIHYVGAVSSAKANAEYFYSANRGASAHYFVDENEIWQVVDDKDAAWHCGMKGKYRHSKCRNSNSLAIEMCVKKNGAGQWYFEKNTIALTVELTRHLMAKYNIPKENVLRHYDVTGKICPEPYVSNISAWNSFLEELTLAEKKEFTVGTYRVTSDVLNVRTGPGIVYTAKEFAEFSENAQHQILAQNGNVAANGYVSNVICDVDRVCGDWGHTPSGWINLKYCVKQN